MKKKSRRLLSQAIAFLLAFPTLAPASQAGLLNLIAPFTPPGLYPTPTSPQSVARMNAIKVYNSGVHEWKNKNLKGAVECFQQALNFDPNLREVHGALGQVLYDAGYFDDAFREMQTATQDYPSDGAYWCMLGLASSHVQRYDVTVDAFQKYLKLKPHGSYADEAKRSIAILQHNVYGGEADRSGSYFAEFSSTTLRKWDSNMIPLRVYIDGGMNVQGYDPAFGNALQQSFNEWTMLSEGRIQFAVVDAPEKAQICCRWTRNKVDLGGSDELGVTHSIWRENGNIEHADIILLTVYESSPRPQEMLRRAKAVYLHEIGHALGLSHSQEPWDIMYPLVAPSGLEFPLTARDKNTLLALYNSDPSGLIAKRFDASFAPINRLAMNMPNQVVRTNQQNFQNQVAQQPLSAFSQQASQSSGMNPGFNAMASPGSMPPPAMLASNVAGGFSDNSQYGAPGMFQSASSGFPQNTINNAPNAFSSPVPSAFANAPFSRSELPGASRGNAPSRDLANVPRHVTASAPASASPVIPTAPSSPGPNLAYNLPSGVGGGTFVGSGFSGAAGNSLELVSSLNRAAAQATARRDFDGAISKLIEARRLAPTDQIIARNLGLAYGNAANVASEGGNYAKALVNFKNAFEILKSHSERGPYDQIYNDYQQMLKKQGQR